MVSSDFVRMMNEREHTEDYIKYVEGLAKREGYILEWDKRIAYAETRCGWREEMQRDREAVRRAKARGCF